MCRLMSVAAVGTDRADHALVAIAKINEVRLNCADGRLRAARPRETARPAGEFGGAREIKAAVDPAIGVCAEEVVAIGRGDVERSLAHDKERAAAEFEMKHFAVGDREMTDMRRPPRSISGDNQEWRAQRHLRRVGDICLGRDLSDDAGLDRNQVASRGR